MQCQIQIILNVFSHSFQIVGEEMSSVRHDAVIDMDSALGLQLVHQLGHKRLWHDFVIAAMDDLT